MKNGSIHSTNRINTFLFHRTQKGGGEYFGGFGAPDASLYVQGWFLKGLPPLFHECHLWKLHRVNALKTCSDFLDIIRKAVVDLGDAPDGSPRLSRHPAGLASHALGIKEETMTSQTA